MNNLHEHPAFYDPANPKNDTARSVGGPWSMEQASSVIRKTSAPPPLPCAPPIDVQADLRRQGYLPQLETEAKGAEKRRRDGDEEEAIDALERVS